MFQKNPEKVFKKAKARFCYSNMPDFDKFILKTLLQNIPSGSLVFSNFTCSCCSRLMSQMLWLRLQRTYKGGGLIRPKKLFLFPETSQVKIFYQARARLIECVSIRPDIFLIKKTTKNPHKTRIQNAKETKEEKRLCVENLTEYDDIVCGFTLSTCNLLDRVVNFSWFVHMNLM